MIGLLLLLLWWNVRRVGNGGWLTVVPGKWASNWTTIRCLTKKKKKIRWRSYPVIRSFPHSRDLTDIQQEHCFVSLCCTCISNSIYLALSIDLCVKIDSKKWKHETGVNWTSSLAMKTSSSFTLFTSLFSFSNNTWLQSNSFALSFNTNYFKNKFKVNLTWFNGAMNMRSTFVINPIESSFDG